MALKKQTRKLVETVPRATEVDAYAFIKETLRQRGWDVRNPARGAGLGQVYTQNECLSLPAISEALNLDRPENIVMVTEKVIWVIEAKRSHRQLEQAIAEAVDYARRISRSGKLQAVFASGVAGNSHDGYLVRNRMFVGSQYKPVVINDAETTALLSKAEAEQLLEKGKPSLDDPPIDERLFIARAEHINEVLHLGAVNPHQRASVMAALLLAMTSDTMPNIETREASVLIDDINSRVRQVLRAQNKEGFFDYTRIPLPSTPDNHVKFRKALVDTIQELNNLNIRSAMNSGADWLGAFYEVFLKYASWAQDLGIVLTPRHVTRYIADVLDIRPNDIVYDPTCGTGGFLVAAFDAVKKKATVAQLQSFKKNSVFGVEQDEGVAALAVVNMIFRGDGKNNIVAGNCFAKNLVPTVSKGVRTASYSEHPSDTPPVTKVMMNPPFSLKRGDEKEFKFVDHALAQTEHGGLLFALLPYSTMVRPQAYRTWRKEVLLPHNSLLAVVTLPNDLFYPVGVTSVGVFIKKGVPHPKGQNVLWARAMNDGLAKSKGKRLPNDRVPDELDAIRDTLKAFLQNPDMRVKAKNQFIKACPIDESDSLVELVSEAYLDQARPTHEAVVKEAEEAIRYLFAHLVKTNNVEIGSVLSAKKTSPLIERRCDAWKPVLISDFFDIARGDFHSIGDLDEGAYPTISRVSTDNGMVGYYSQPDGADVYPPGTLTVSTVTGDAFVQPVPFIATDNVLLCTPKAEFEGMKLTTLFFVQVMLNEVKWRYSYGRQCYRAKFGTTKVMLPFTATGDLDEVYMADIINGTAYWQFVKPVMMKREDRIGK